MKPDTEIVDRAAFLRALKNKGKNANASHSQPRERGARQSGQATLSGAHSEPGQGDRTKALERIAEYRFSPRYRAGIGFDFWHCDGRVTSAHATYAAAVEAAERELKR